MAVMRTDEIVAFLAKMLQKEVVSEKKQVLVDEIGSPCWNISCCPRAL